MSENHKPTESESTPSDSPEARLAHALNTLQYDANPRDRPVWLTGLNKPLPHPSLTAQQDFEIETRFWIDEIARLQHLRARLETPGGDRRDGEWHYEHFGSTLEVSKRTGNRSRIVLARGVWRFVVGGGDGDGDGVVEVQMLDEYPMTLEGETLGWGVRGDLADFEVSGEESAGEDEGEKERVEEEDEAEAEDVDGGDLMLMGD